MFSDPGAADTHTITINWGDGSLIETRTSTVDASGGVTIPLTHVYADNGDWTLMVTVTDDDDGVGSDTAVMHVANVAPTVEAGVDQTVREGATVSVVASFQDPGAADTHTATIDWGDGTVEAGMVRSTVGPDGVRGTVTGSHMYANAGDHIMTVNVADDDGGMAADTLTVTVIANRAPRAADDAYSVVEDTVLTVPAAGVLGNDQDADGDTLTAALVNGPGFGQLTLNLDGSFSYMPGVDFHGSDTFTYTASDGKATSAPATVSIDVQPVNDAPVARNESFTTLEDTPLTVTAPGVLDNDTDIDSVNLSALLVTPVQHGTLTLNGNGAFTYTPAANYDGSDSFTYKANDGVLDSNIATVAITITALNDAPVGTGTTVTMLEDTAYTFNVADFGFTDPHDSPPNTLLAVQITSVPAAGILTDKGTPVTAGQFISVGDLNTGKLVFTPVPNANGLSYATFTFHVQDNGGTANGGNDLDPTSRTLTLNVTPVNDAPAGTDTTVTTLEDTAYTFTAADFGFRDPADSLAHALNAVQITTLVTDGVLTLGGRAIAVNQVIPVASLNAGALQFSPDLNENGSTYATFTFQVQDNGGTTNNGVDFDPIPKTMTLTVTPVNDTPSFTKGTDQVVSENAGPQVAFFGALMGVTMPLGQAVPENAGSRTVSVRACKYNCV
jgi:VCBS repeat-containing protein